MKNRSFFRLCVVAVLLMALLACNLSIQTGDTERRSTVEALETSIVGTNTAAASQQEATPTQEPAQPTATLEQVPTQASPVVQESPLPFDLSATQTAFVPFLGELSAYGVDPQRGQLGWFQPPLSVEIDEYHGSKFDNKFPMVIAKDFVMSADITWDTQYGGSGCGFVFRSDGNPQAPNQYMVIASRMAQGHVVFAVMAQGEFITGKDFYANGIDPQFNDSNGATNRLTVVGQGSIFTIYSNGTKLGDADPNRPLPPLLLPSKPPKPLNLSDPVANEAYQRAVSEYQRLVKKLKAEYQRRLALWSKVDRNFESGFTAMGAMADSGRTLCEFNNAWLWLMAESGE